MADQTDKLLAQLERISARLESIPPDDVDSLVAAMDERSAVIVELGALLKQARPEALPECVLERLGRQLAVSETLARRLLLLQAATRAELGRLLAEGFLTRSLARGAVSSPNIDWRG